MPSYTDLGRACAADTGLRRRVREELERAVSSSAWNATAHSLLANVALQDGRRDDARRHLVAALDVDPTIGRAHERLGLIALHEGRPAEALEEFHHERRISRNGPGTALRIGQAYRAMGDATRARTWYEREVRRDPGNQAARDSLASIR
jgi:tetratricopeptide (TPR) repeat protein